MLQDAKYLLDEIHPWQRAVCHWKPAVIGSRRTQVGPKPVQRGEFHLLRADYLHHTLSVSIAISNAAGRQSYREEVFTECQC